jgi:hypothetical protein
MAATDKRLGLATEVINNIKVVKFFSWVSEFSDMYWQPISKFDQFMCLFDKRDQTSCSKCKFYAKQN